MDNASYLRKNLEFNKKVLFRLGIDAGFFSEYNNMIITIHYCLAHNIRFILNSNEANFSFKKGWQDYFIPFTKESNFPLNKYYQDRFAPYYPIRFRDKIGYLVFRKWLKLRKIDFITSEILPLAIKQDVRGKYEIPGSGLGGTLAQNCRILSKMIWQLKPEVRQKTETLANSVELPESYIGFHIRRGDKHKETKFLPLELYMNEAEKHTKLRTAFIATDDYTVYEDLCTNYSHWKFYTLTQPVERGYHQKNQLSKSRFQIREEMIRLLTDVEILASADYFFGTFTSNISLFLALQMPTGRCIGVDFNEWRIWS